METKVPTSLTFQENKDYYDKDRKKKLSPVTASLLLKNLLEYSPEGADKKTFNHYQKPKGQGTRNRKSPQLLHSCDKKKECTHKELHQMATTTIHALYILTTNSHTS